MKLCLKLIVILSFFGFIGAVTFVKPAPFDPCRNYVNDLLLKDSLVRANLYDFVNDSIVVSTIKDSLWDIKTAQICDVLKDSCKVNGRKVLVVDQSDDPAQRDTRFGKKIYFRNCP